MSGSATCFELPAWLQSHLTLIWILLQHCVSVPLFENYTKILVHNSDGSNSKYFIWLTGGDREQKFPTEM